MQLSRRLLEIVGGLYRAGTVTGEDKRALAIQERVSVREIEGALDYWRDRDEDEETPENTCANCGAVIYHSGTHCGACRDIERRLCTEGQTDEYP